MTLTAFWLILISSGLHVAWNTLAKKNHLSFPFYAILCTVAMLMWIHTLWWAPVKLSSLPAEFWCCILLSLISDAVIYCTGLICAYKTLEMSLAYPVMRSLPLLFIALVTSIFHCGKSLGAGEICGMATVVAGCIIMPLSTTGKVTLASYFNRGTVFILMVACGTTGYTFFDSEAMKIITREFPETSKTVVAMTFYATRGGLLSAVLWAISLSTAANREIIKKLIRKKDFTPLYAGVVASGAYICVLLAMNFVDNVSFVVAFRQIGLVIGVLAGVIFLKEKAAPAKRCGRNDKIQRQGMRSCSSWQGAQCSRCMTGRIDCSSQTSSRICTGRYSRFFHALVVI